MPDLDYPITSELPESSFVDALQELMPQMRAFARSLCRDADLADDIVQETCLKALAAKARFIPGAPMKPWLFRILRNVHAQIGRRAWRSVPLDPEDAERALVSPDNFQWCADMQVMQNGLTLLPEKQREALIIVLAAGFSYEEAGNILGCSEGTVKSRVSRAREALIAIMNDPHHGRGGNAGGSRPASNPLKTSAVGAGDLDPGGAGLKAA